MSDVVGSNHADAIYWVDMNGLRAFSTQPRECERVLATYIKVPSASYVSDLEARLEKAEAERDDWQPMATAPKDGTPILCYCDPRDYPFLAYYGHVGRYTSTPKMWIGHIHGAMDTSSISAWMPLPTPRALKDKS